MPELGPYGSVRGARGNSRPYRESHRLRGKPTRLTPMYGPAVWCKRLWSTLADAILRQCIRPLIGACAPGHHGYQRACDATTAEISSRRAACCSQGMLSTLICGRPGLSTRLSSTACPISTAAERNR